MAAFHPTRLALKLVDSLSPRTYMRVYLRVLRMLGVGLCGTPRYISTGVKFDDFELVTLGDRVVISDKVILLTHDYSVTTALIAGGSTPATDVARRLPIIVGNNVFIGMSSILLPGTRIGDNVIIGAGSVIRGSIPSGSVVVGNPGASIGSITELGERWGARLEGSDMVAD